MYNEYVMLYAKLLMFISMYNFHQPEEELGSKFSMEWNPNLQSSQLLLDSWHPQNFETTLDSKQKENFDCASMNSLLDEIQSLKLIVKEKSLFSSPSFERFLPRLKTVNGNCFSKSYANDTTAASSGEYFCYKILNNIMHVLKG